MIWNSHAQYPAKSLRNPNLRCFEQSENLPKLYGNIRFGTAKFFKKTLAKRASMIPENFRNSNCRLLLVKILHGTPNIGSNVTKLYEEVSVDSNLLSFQRKTVNCSQFDHSSISKRDNVKQKAAVASSDSIQKIELKSRFKASISTNLARNLRA